MAKFVEFPEANMVWKGDGKDVGDLPAHRTEVPLSGGTGTLSISCWELSPDELAEVQRTGQVWLHSYGRHQPVLIMGTCPFQRNGEEST